MLNETLRGRKRSTKRAREALVTREGGIWEVVEVRGI